MNNSMNFSARNGRGHGGAGVGALVGSRVSFGLGAAGVNNITRAARINNIVSVAGGSMAVKNGNAGVNSAAKLGYTATVASSVGDNAARVSDVSNGAAGINNNDDGEYYSAASTINATSSDWDWVAPTANAVQTQVCSKLNKCCKLNT